MTLHVTNGDAAVPRLRAGGVDGEILCWRDVLHDGPVVRGDWELVRLARSAFLASLGAGGERDIRDSFTMRDSRLLGAARDGEDIVLWFEHDLYDQLQLAQVVAMLAGERAARPRLAQAEDYLGSMGEEAVRSLAAGTRPLTAEESAAGVECWQALTAEQPLELERFATAPGPLPLLRAAMRRLLEEWPSTRDGLSRSERQALAAIDAGAATIGDAYVRSHHQSEPATWMGDASFAVLLARLASGEEPLVSCDDGAPLPMVANRETFARRVSLTPAGEDVLAGRADFVERHGIDRWIGGAHLRGRSVPWRWDIAEQRIVGSLSS